MRVRTFLSLGILNIFRVFCYRLGLRFSVHPVLRINSEPSNGPFVKKFSGTQSKLKSSGKWDGETPYFGFHKVNLGGDIPRWLVNPHSDVVFSSSQRPWWKIPDFDPQAGDIKIFWEASRFDWLLPFSQEAAIGDEDKIAKINTWIADWLLHNPPYTGPNWKCGQEASLRVIHLVAALKILSQVTEMTAGMKHLITAHLKRIAPTMSYAVAQDNNHGTSEAAALFIGGALVKLAGESAGEKWMALGRKWLENRTRRLIEVDGSFSQYSLNYHRMMLDTLSFAEIIRRDLNLPLFSDCFYGRTQAATRWLRSMINEENGDGPNLGANDGARILPLTETGYREFRPTVQLASILFFNKRSYAEPGEYDFQVKWMGIDIPTEVLPQSESEVFDDGGYAVLRNKSGMLLFRYPRFHFRPSQADALHVDLWLNGVNVLRDAGTYSYNTEDRWLKYFPGTESHNTIQFDDRDQMPRISRFLFGNWLKTLAIKTLTSSQSSASFGASYRDDQGSQHHREVALGHETLIVNDIISNFDQKAVLRWRLVPGAWVLNGTHVTNGRYKLSINSSMPISRIELVEGWESRFYLQKDNIPVLEVEFAKPGRITTEFSW